MKISVRKIKTIIKEELDSILELEQDSPEGSENNPEKTKFLSSLKKIAKENVLIYEKIIKARQELLKSKEQPEFQEKIKNAHAQKKANNLSLNASKEQQKKILALFDAPYLEELQKLKQTYKDLLNEPLAKGLFGFERADMRYPDTRKYENLEVKMPEFYAVNMPVINTWESSMKRGHCPFCLGYGHFPETRVSHIMTDELELADKTGLNWQDINRMYKEIFKTGEISRTAQRSFNLLACFACSSSQTKQGDGKYKTMRKNLGVPNQQTAPAPVDIGPTSSSQTKQSVPEPIDFGNQNENKISLAKIIEEELIKVLKKK